MQATRKTALLLKTYALGLATLAALGLAAALPQPAAAQTPGLTIVTPGFSRSASTPNQYGDFADGTVGFQFTVGAQAVTVMGLGYYVGNSDGSLAESHQVGIFSADGTASVGTTATLGPGAAGTYAPDAFVYVPVTPFTLSANTSYLIGGYTGANNTDPFLEADGVDVATPGSGIASIDGAAYGSPGFTAPTTSGGAGSIAYLGPNFEVAAAPEPSQSAALGLGVLGLAGLALKARRRAAAL